MKRNIFNPVWQAELAKHMTIDDVERTANMFGEQFGEDCKDEYLSAMFDGLHQVGNK